MPNGTAETAERLDGRNAKLYDAKRYARSVARALPKSHFQGMKITDIDARFLLALR